jgi:hypothetical protein
MAASADVDDTPSDPISGKRELTTLGIYSCQTTIAPPNRRRLFAYRNIEMRHLDGDRRAVDQHDLVRPVELVGLSRREAKRSVSSIQFLRTT